MLFVAGQCSPDAPVAERIQFVRNWFCWGKGDACFHSFESYCNNVVCMFRGGTLAYVETALLTECRHHGLQTLTYQMFLRGDWLASIVQVGFPSDNSPATEQGSLWSICEDSQVQYIF